jgi:meso-butanediol dehydrogenase/(S,S)-butanediol dehydrogenase/diacetyl reductase
MKVAIVTGAGSGIGYATALELSRRGFTIVLVGRTPVKLQAAAKEIGHDSLAIVADVTRDADAIIQKTLAKFGRINVLVNNAGFAPAASIEQTTPKIWHEVMETNLSAVFYLCRAAWSALTKNGGAIVNISSMAARDPFAGFLAYGAAKAGLNTFGLSLAREGEPHGVRVYTIAPGAVETPMLRAIVSTEQLPADQTLSPAEVASVVGQCVSGESSYASGEVVWLDKS